jgi:polysaccharide pyruvyl transferase WcaK-like protein
MLSPQTIGPFTRTPYRQMARFALTRAKAVAARDEESLRALSSLAPDARGLLSVDVAFALPHETRRHLRGGERARIGVNVSGLLFNDAEAGMNPFGLEIDYARLTWRFLADLSADPAVEIHLITHVAWTGGGRDNDGPVADRLAGAFPGAVRVPDFAGPSEAKSYISGLDFLVAGRMHACIAAFSSGVPVVPVAYSRKFTGLFDMLGYRWVVPVRGLDTDAALALLHDGLARRDELAADVEMGLGKAAALLENYRSALEVFLREAADRP